MTVTSNSGKKPEKLEARAKALAAEAHAQTREITLGHTLNALRRILPDWVIDNPYRAHYRKRGVNVRLRDLPPIVVVMHVILSALQTTHSYIASSQKINDIASILFVAFGDAGDAAK